MQIHARGVVQDQAWRAGAQIVFTLLGGLLLLNSLLASWLFAEAFHAGALAAAGALLLGAPLVAHAVEDLWRGHSHLDELVALAFVSAFAEGAAGVKDPAAAYQTAGAIAFFMLLSGLIEHRTALGARASIESLIRITPTRAMRLSAGGEQEVEARELRPGDHVRVRPGDCIPGDGRVVSGLSIVNQAPITGESLPVDKAAGEEVFGGTLNLTGVLEIEITKAGADTTLGKVQELILQAEATRTPIARLIDQYAHWYTPVVLMLAGGTLAFTHELDRAIAILVAACPCAIVLATPTAMVAALSAAARLGLLVKNVSDLEAARHLTAAVFDKTGTLTTGELTVTRLGPAAGVEAADLLAAAASVEQNSKHPVARAVLEVARRARVDLQGAEGFEELAGRGARARVNGEEVLMGRASWLREQGVETPAEDAGTEGLSMLYAARAGRLLGWIGLEDRTRPEAAAALDALRQAGLKQLIMVTGDRLPVARRVAREMHCTDVQAEVLPAQKLELVDRLKKQGHRVAVIGDGVNDAPALAAGDIGVAMGAAGSDVAIHSASVALMNNNLNRLPFLVRISQRLNSVVRQNLIFAVLFILVVMPLGATGWLSPLGAALLHVFASVFVVFNSARLVREGEELDAGATGGLSLPPPVLRAAAASGG